MSPHCVTCFCQIVPFATLAAWSERQEAARNLAEHYERSYDLEPGVLISTDRRARVVRVRNEAMTTLRKMGWTFAEIGHVFNRDHSTVMHSVQKAKVQQ